MLSQNRIIELSRLEKTFKSNHQPHLLSLVTESRPFSAMSASLKYFLGWYSSTTAVGSLFQFLTFFFMNAFFLVSNLNFPWSNLVPLWKPLRIWHCDFHLVLSTLHWTLSPDTSFTQLEIEPESCLCTCITPSSNPLMTSCLPILNLKGLFLSLEESNFFPFCSIPAKRRDTVSIQATSKFKCWEVWEKEVKN